MFIIKEENLLVSSDPSNGAINRSADGSSFEVQLQDALQIPNDAINVTLSVDEASIWWVSPNITQGVNDKFYITAPDASDVVTPYTITIGQGLYDLSGLNQALLRELENAGAKVSPTSVLNLTADENTQKVEIVFNYDTVSVDFTQADTCRDILGFNSAIIGPYVSVPHTTLADNVATFNTINYFLLHSDLTSKGLRINNKYDQTISKIDITVAPGSLINASPFNPAKINANELRGSKRTNLRFWLTSDNGTLVNTNSEYFSARIVIRYSTPYHVI